MDKLQALRNESRGFCEIKKEQNDGIFQCKGFVKVQEFYKGEVVAKICLEKHEIKCLFYLTKFEEWYKVKDRVVTRGGFYGKSRNFIKSWIY